MATSTIIYSLGMAYLAILMLKSGLALRYVSTYPKLTTASRIADVTICQPILGGDPQLKQVLADNLRALPEARFLWLIDQDDPEAQSVTSKLIEGHPNHAIEVMVLPPAPDGINPKLFKLDAGREKIRTPFLLVLDDDTRLTHRSLQALLGALENAELATGLPFYRDDRSALPNLLGQFVNNNSAQTYLPLLHFADPVSINGMCYALRLDTLTKIQGFQPILRHLTDDLAMADLIRKHGGIIHQTPLPQEVATSIHTISEYVRQMHRWFVFAILLMRRQPPQMNILITLLHGLPPLLLIAVLALAAAKPSISSSLFLVLLLTIRAICLCIVQYTISGKLRHHPFLSLVSELLQPLHLIHAACWRSIRWRSRRYYVFENDRFESR